MRLIITTGCFLLLSIMGVFAQEKYESSLAKADSLFDVRKYTESFKIYDYLLAETKQTSPAMLLRMSFIKEGLGNYTEALYYLNLYYLQTTDRKVLTKMEELASKKGLYGYDFSDWEFIQTIFYKYFFHLVAVLVSLAVLLLVLMYYQKIRLKHSPVFTACAMVVILGLLFYTLNFGKQYKKSMVIENNTYVMTGPSAGAEVLAIIEKGHRVDVDESKDVWTKVNWKGQPGFVKRDKLKAITF